MYRHSLTAISFFLFFCTSVTADDYLLRVETTGFRDRPQNEKLPDHEILESIEIVARINQPFYGNSTIGSTKVSINGIVEQLNDGRFRAQIRYRRSTDSDESFKGANGLPIATANSTSISAAADVELQQPSELGKVDVISRTQDGTELKTKTRIVLSLVKFDPAKE